MRNSLRKFLSILICLCIALVITGCGNAFKDEGTVSIDVGSMYAAAVKASREAGSIVSEQEQENPDTQDDDTGSIISEQEQDPDYYDDYDDIDDQDDDEDDDEDYTDEKYILIDESLVVQAKITVELSGEGYKGAKKSNTLKIPLSKFEALDEDDSLANEDDVAKILGISNSFLTFKDIPIGSVITAHVELATEIAINNETKLRKELKEFFMKQYADENMTNDQLEEEIDSFISWYMEDMIYDSFSFGNIKGQGDSLPKVIENGKNEITVELSMEEKEKPETNSSIKLNFKFNDGDGNYVAKTTFPSIETESENFMTDYFKALTGITLAGYQLNEEESEFRIDDDMSLSEIMKLFKETKEITFYFDKVAAVLPDTVTIKLLFNDGDGKYVSKEKFPDIVIDLTDPDFDESDITDTLEDLEEPLAEAGYIPNNKMNDWVDANFKLADYVEDGKCELNLYFDKSTIQLPITVTIKTLFNEGDGNYVPKDEFPDIVFTITNLNDFEDPFNEAFSELESKFDETDYICNEEKSAWLFDEDFELQNYAKDGKCELIIYFDIDTYGALPISITLSNLPAEDEDSDTVLVSVCTILVDKTAFNKFVSVYINTTKTESEKIEYLARLLDSESDCTALYRAGKEYGLTVTQKASGLEAVADVTYYVDSDSSFNKIVGDEVGIITITYYGKSSGFYTNPYIGYSSSTITLNEQSNQVAISPKHSNYFPTKVGLYNNEAPVYDDNKELIRFYAAVPESLKVSYSEETLEQTFSNEAVVQSYLKAGYEIKSLHCSSFGNNGLDNSELNLVKKEVPPTPTNPVLSIVYKNGTDETILDSIECDPTLSSTAFEEAFVDVYKTLIHNGYDFSQSELNAWMANIEGAEELFNYICANGDAVLYFDAIVRQSINEFSGNITNDTSLQGDYKFITYSDYTYEIVRNEQNSQPTVISKGTWEPVYYYDEHGFDHNNYEFCETGYYNFTTSAMVSRTGTSTQNIYIKNSESFEFTSDSGAKFTFNEPTQKTTVSVEIGLDIPTETLSIKNAGYYDGCITLQAKDSANTSYTSYTWLVDDNQLTETGYILDYEPIKDGYEPGDVITILVMAIDENERVHTCTIQVEVEEVE